MKNPGYIRRCLYGDIYGQKASGSLAQVKSYWPWKYLALERLLTKPLFTLFSTHAPHGRTTCRQHLLHTCYTADNVSVHVSWSITHTHTQSTPTPHDTQLPHNVAASSAIAASLCFSFTRSALSARTTTAMHRLHPKLIHSWRLLRSLRLPNYYYFTCAKFICSHLLKWHPIIVNFRVSLILLPARSNSTVRLQRWSAWCIMYVVRVHNYGNEKYNGHSREQLQHTTSTYCQHTTQRDH